VAQASPLRIFHAFINQLDDSEVQVPPYPCLHAADPGVMCVFHKGHLVRAHERDNKSFDSWEDGRSVEERRDGLGEVLVSRYSGDAMQGAPVRGMRKFGSSWRMRPETIPLVMEEACFIVDLATDRADAEIGCIRGCAGPDLDMTNAHGLVLVPITSCSQASDQKLIGPFSYPYTAPRMPTVPLSRINRRPSLLDLSGQAETLRRTAKWLCKALSSHQSIQETEREIYFD